MHSAVSVSGDRELVVSEDLLKGDILLEIPLRCLPCCASIQTTTIGRKLGDCIASISEELYCEEQDLLMALFLAHQVEYGWSEGEACDYRPYLATLPTSSEFNSLPRRWSDENKHFLHGSRLLYRIEQVSVGLARDYSLLSVKWGDVDGFASLETFDTMMAAETSRAVAGMGASRNDIDISMVPLLDMCNHRRGVEGQNITYRRLDSSVQAIAKEDIQTGKTLQITYGARGNAQLLFNYGFALENNVEPDGSSNDVVEVQLEAGSPLVHLRTGPKKYTFGCFSKAVEQFHEQNLETEIEGDGPDDLEDFLKGCDTNSGFCVFEDVEREDDDEEDPDSVNTDAEIGAVRKLERALVAARLRYGLNGEECKTALTSRDPRVRYAGILIHSEVRTIQFYELACTFIVARMMETEVTHFKWAIEVDEVLLKIQATDLAGAFLQIRCPGFRDESTSQ